MASRKDLKKDIKFVSVELISECYVRFIFNPSMEKEINDIVMEINKLNYDTVTRINHTDGKNNPKITKAYYKKLKADYENGMKAILTKLESIKIA